MKHFRERPAVRWAVLVALALGSLGIGASALAQCTVSGLAQFAPPAGAGAAYGPSGKFRTGYATSADLFTYQGQRMLLMRENFGYSIYDLSTPGSPANPLWCDVEGTYHKAGDGFNTVFSVGAAADGSRILVGYLEPHQVLVMSRGSGSPNCAFNFSGEFGSSRAIALDIAALGSRSLGFGLGGTSMAVTDVTNAVPSGATPVYLPSEKPAGTGGGIGNGRAVVGNTFVSWSLYGVTFINFANAGPAGSIAPGLVVKTFNLAAFGFPSNISSGYFGQVAVAQHPVNGKTYILAEALAPGSYSSKGYVLATFDGTNLTQVGPLWTPPPGYIGGGAATAVATVDDVVFFAWGSTTDGLQNKLFTLSAGSWGTDQTPSALWSVSSFPNSSFTGAVYSQAIHTGNGQVYLYTLTGVGAFASPVTCSSTAIPTRFYTLPPCRVLDTRLQDGPLGGPILAAGETRSFAVAGACGIPASAVSLSANVTVPQAGADGFLRAFAGDGATPDSSVISFAAGKARANNLTVRLSSDGLGAMKIGNVSTGSTHVLLDASGYWAP